MDFKHNSQHVAAAAAASIAQQNGIISVSAMQGQQLIAPAQQQQPLGGNTSTAGQVATLLPQQPQHLKPGGNQISPTLSGNIMYGTSEDLRSMAKIEIGQSMFINTKILRTLNSFLAGATSSGLPVSAPRQIEPMFHTVPPRPQRLLHSEAYIR